MRAIRSSFSAHTGTEPDLQGWKLHRAKSIISVERRDCHVAAGEHREKIRTFLPVYVKCYSKANTSHSKVY